MNEINREMAEFCQSLGLTKYDQIPSIDISIVIDELSNGFNGKTTEEVEQVLFKLHSYSIFLKNKKSTLKSWIGRLEQIVDKFVAENLDKAEDKYVPFNIKREQIVMTDQNISDAYYKSIKAKSHLEKIGDIPYSIDKAIVSIENYLRRRYSN